MALQPQRSQIRHLRVLSDQNAEHTLYDHFGKLLQALRNRKSLTREQAIEAFAPHFQREQVPELSPKTLGNLERDERFPQYDEVWALFLGFLHGCEIQITTDEQKQFVDLAQQKTDQSQKWRRPASAWNALRTRIAEHIQQHKQEIPSLQTLSNTTQHKQEIEQIPLEVASFDSNIDISHIIGRDEFVNRQLTYLEPYPGSARIKVSLFYALTGTGKTSVLKLLRKRLSERDVYDVFHYEFDTRAKDKTSADHLHDFLAKILLRLGALQGEAAKPPTLQERIQQVMKEIARAKKHLVLVLDDFQMALEPSGELGSVWEQFFKDFVEGTHLATIYLASRVRPRWQMRARAFITETELTQITVDAGVQIWRNLGFAEEDKAVLYEATRKCGGNPGMMEMISLHIQKPVISFSWTTPDESDLDETDLERYIRDPHYLSNEDLALDAFPILEEVIATRITPEARQLLNVLAVAPVPLAPALLRYLCKAPGPLYQELLQASLLSSDRYRVYLLPLVAESVRQQSTKTQILSIEEQVLDLYNKWLDAGEFRDDAEQVAVTTETIVLYLQHRRLLEAAHLLLLHGWRCLSFGHASRLARVAMSVIGEAGFDWQTDLRNYAGGTLILYQMGRKTGLEARAADYTCIYQLAREGRISLGDSEIIHLAHHIMQYAVEERQFLQANTVCNEALSFLSSESDKHLDIEIEAQAIYTKAHFLGSWSDDKRTHNEKEESIQLNEQAVATLIQGIQLLREWEQHASPLRKRNIHFKLARFLHSLGYRKRLLGDLIKAEEALNECLQLKKSGSAAPLSLAVSLGEYAQLLTAQGNIREALLQNAHALEIVRNLLDAGDRSDQVGGDMKMHLTERGLILLQQAKFNEAKQCFIEALSYTQKSRRMYHDIAKEKLQMLELLTTTSVANYQLDEHWFSLYDPLTRYDEIQALTPAGPFTELQQSEWHNLSNREDDEAQAQKSKIVLGSLQRELTLARQEQREPRIWYPMISIEEISRLKIQLRQLRAKIEEHEENALVRRIYKETIDEHLTILAITEAVYDGNMSTFWQCNLQVYPQVDLDEFKYALSLFVPMINRALRVEQTHVLANQLLKLLRRWQIPLDGIEMPKTVEPMEVRKTNKASMHMISANALKRSMEEILRLYGFNQCRVQIEPKRNDPYIQASLHTIFLPDKEVSEATACEYVGEELETHLYRAEVGYRSPLAILGSGLPHYQATDEGLAYHYIEQIAKVQGRKRSFAWLGTLSIGLATGIIAAPLSFRQLSNFLELAFSLRNFLSGPFETMEQAQIDAVREADERALRTFRGVTNLNDPTVRGICSIKDNLYLHGYLQVGKKQKENIHEQLLVGKIAIDHLPIMEELAITAPAIPHRQIALQPNLGAWIASFEDE
jgi:tetratricopeptide (TPR) repeat protein